eukprot:2240853-Amphidinium_carterae.1
MPAILRSAKLLGPSTCQRHKRVSTLVVDVLLIDDWNMEPTDAMLLPSLSVGKAVHAAACGTRATGANLPSSMMAFGLLLRISVLVLRTMPLFNMS